MSSGVGLVPAELASLVLETLLTGICLVLASTAIYVLVFKRGVTQGSYAPAAQFNRVLFGVTVALTCSVLAHWLLNVCRAFDAFIYDVENPGTLLIFANLADPKNVIKTGIYVFEGVLADCVLIYRLFIVWGRNKRIIILPCCVTLATLVCGTGITYEFSQVPLGEDIFTSECGRWIASSFSAVLITNLYSSSLIAYRVWQSNRRVKALGSSLWPTLQIIIESAIIYTASTFTTLVAYLAKSNIQFPSVDATSPIIGIVFCLIIVRVELGISQKYTSQTSTGGSNSRSYPPFGRSAYTSNGSTGVIEEPNSNLYNLRPLAVNITKDVRIGDNVGYLVEESRGNESIDKSIL